MFWRSLEGRLGAWSLVLGVLLAGGLRGQAQISSASISYTYGANINPGSYNVTETGNTFGSDSAVSFVSSQLNATVAVTNTREASSLISSGTLSFTNLGPTASGIDLSVNIQMTFLVPVTREFTFTLVTPAVPGPVLGGTSFFRLDGSTLTNGARQVAAGSHTINIQIAAGSASAVDYSTSFELRAETVPEPSTWALLGLGAAATGWAIYRGRRRTV